MMILPLAKQLRQRRKPSFRRRAEPRMSRAYIPCAKSVRIGMKAMQFAADYPARTRTLSVVHVPAVTNASVPASPTSFARQSARLGSAASKEMVDYWENMFGTAPEIPTKGLLAAGAQSDPARDGVLQRLKAPTLLMTADRGQLQSVEKARQYQMLIPNSRLAVLRSDGYHIAASNADECVTNVLAFIKEASRRA